MSQQAFYAQILDAAGLDAIHEHYGLSSSQPIPAEQAGFETIQKILEAAKGVLGQFGVTIGPETVATVKAAMNQALDYAFTLIDWPIVPDAPIDAVIRVIVNRWFDRAVNEMVSGS